MNANDEYYGLERLERAMIGAMRLDIGDLAEAIVDDILKFSGSQALADDLCLVAAEAVRKEVKVRGSVQPPEQRTQTAES